MADKEQVAVIIPSFHSRELTSLCIRSLQRFCPLDIDLIFIVVENSSDVSYKDNIIGLGSNIIWVNNATTAVGSEANAEAIEIGLTYVKCNLVFMCHCDICITSEKFLHNMVIKYHEGNRLVGTLTDTNPNRIGAIHVFGLLTDLELAKKVKYMPIYKNKVQIMDIGNELTRYCRDNKLSIYCFKNTHNNPTITESLDKKYAGFNVVRCVDDQNNVMFMHLGRGIKKMFGTYSDLSKVSLRGWLEFCNEVIK